MKLSLIFVINFIIFVGIFQDVSIHIKTDDDRQLENQSMTQGSKTIINPTPTPKSTLENSLSSRKKTPLSTSIPTFLTPEIPPADPNLGRIIIGAGILIVAVVIIGVWINRNRLR